MRLLVLVGLSIALMTGSLAAQAEGEPLRLVKSFYARNFKDETLPMTQRLKALYGQASATSKRRNEPVSGMDFVWTLGAQDAEDGWEKTLRFTLLNADPKAALVQVKFRLFAKDKDRELHYVLARERGRWRVADIRYLADSETLAGLFAKGAKGE